jgi:multidrug resistance efflux pump
MASTLSTRVRGWIVSIAILGIALGLIFVLSSNWTTWASAGEEQETDDAYLRADVTPLSTKAAGLVASVEVSDYQPVKAGDLLARLQDDDFKPRYSGRISVRDAHRAPRIKRFARYISSPNEGSH